MYNELIKEKQFKIFCNSYFIEAFHDEYQENGIKMISFSNMRKEQYQIKTIMKDDFIYKYSNSGNSKNHINNIRKNIDLLNKMNFDVIDKYDDEKIISKYLEHETFDNTIYNLFKTNEKEQAIQLIKKFKDELYSKMEFIDCKENVFDKYNINYLSSNVTEMKFVKYGLWDLTFDNCFYINNKFYFYDQEWMENNLPIDFIIYRAIKYCSKIKEYIEFEELCEICNIKEKDKILFEKLDDYIQKEIRNDEYWIMHKNGKTIDEYIIQKLTCDHKINLLNAENINLKNQVQTLTQENAKLHSEIGEIYNSRAWNTINKLRKIKKIGKKKDKK